MNIEHLFLFIKICELGSLSKVSEIYHIPKTTLSTMLSNMEKELNTKLLIRSTRGVIPTNKGLVFLEDVQTICHITEGWKNLSDSNTQDNIRLAIMSSLNIEAARHLFQKIIKKYPNIQLDIIVARSQNLIMQTFFEKLYSITFTLLVDEYQMLLENFSNQYQIECLYQEPFHLIISKNSTLSNKSSVQTKDLKNLTLVINAGNDMPHSMQRHTAYFKNVIRVDGFHQALEIIKNDSTCAGLFQPITVPNNDLYQTIPVTDLEDIGFFTLIYPPKDKISTIEQLVVDTIRYNYLILLKSNG